MVPALWGLAPYYPSSSQIYLVSQWSCAFIFNYLKCWAESSVSSQELNLLNSGCCRRAVWAEPSDGPLLGARLRLDNAELRERSVPYWEQTSTLSSRGCPSLFPPASFYSPQPPATSTFILRQLHQTCSHRSGSRGTCRGSLGLQSHYQG